MTSGRTIAFVLLLCASARAQSRAFDLDHLQVAVTGGDFIGAEGAGRVRRWGFRVGAAYRFSDQQLTLDRGAGIRAVLVESRSVLELSGAFTLWRRFTVGIALPVLLDQSGLDVVRGAAQGDIRVIPRLEIVRDGRFGLAALLGLRLPSGATDRFLGEGMVVFEPRLAAQLYLGRNDILRLGANLGFRFREDRQYQDLTLGHQIFFSVAAALLPKPWIDLHVELHSATMMSRDFGSARVSPLELLVGLGGGWKGFHIGAAAGLGLVDGFGQARVRGLVTFEYRKPAPLSESRVVVPTTPRPAPMPKPKTPTLPELPDIDDDVEQAVAFPDEPDVQFSNGRIELADPIFFKTNRKRVQSRFLGELEHLARALGRRPEIRIVWIEGHADATGPEAWNFQLSRARAEEVAQFLARHGVQRARLAPVGWGEARPLAATPHGQSNERNRRVHFYTDLDEVNSPKRSVSQLGGPP